MKLFLTFLLGSITVASWGQTVFVSSGGTGNGSSWANATGDLQAVLDAASPNTEIWVKEGIYYPTQCDDCNINDRSEYFEVPDGVRLIGGFAGTESDGTQRDIEAHPTILSGDIDGDGTLNNNSFTIVYTENVTSATLVDGFIIRDGHAQNINYGLDNPSNSGAGWFNRGSTNDGASHPTLLNCRFEGNYTWGYGSGMYNDGSYGGAASPHLTNCVFIENQSRLGGAGIYNAGIFEGEASPTLSHCSFEKNESLESEGGAMFNTGAELGQANPLLSHCSFIDNIAFHDGGGFGPRRLYRPVRFPGTAGGRTLSGCSGCACEWQSRILGWRI